MSTHSKIKILVDLAENRKAFLGVYWSYKITKKYDPNHLHDYQQRKRIAFLHECILRRKILQHNLKFCEQPKTNQTQIDTNLNQLSFAF
jgi:hypothetical protein